MRPIHTDEGQISLNINQECEPKNDAFMASYVSEPDLDRRLVALHHYFVTTGAEALGIYYTALDLDALADNYFRRSVQHSQSIRSDLSAGASEGDLRQTLRKELPLAQLIVRFITSKGTEEHASLGKTFPFLLELSAMQLEQLLMLNLKVVENVFSNSSLSQVDKKLWGDVFMWMVEKLITGNLFTIDTHGAAVPTDNRAALLSRHRASFSLGADTVSLKRYLYINFDYMSLNATPESSLLALAHERAHDHYFSCEMATGTYEPENYSLVFHEFFAMMEQYRLSVLIDKPLSLEAIYEFFDNPEFPLALEIPFSNMQFVADITKTNVLLLGAYMHGLQQAKNRDRANCDVQNILLKTHTLLDVSPVM